MMNDYWGQGAERGTDVGGFIFMLIMMALLVVGALVLVRYLSHGAADHHKAETALGLLEKRYANGEIDTKEFEEKRKVLSS